MFTTFVGRPPSNNSSAVSRSPPESAAPPAGSPPAPRPRQKKRSQVARACDWCRVHRIKCDNDHPCTNCKNRGGQCSNSSASKSPTLPHAYREMERLKQRVQELEQELQKERKAEIPTPQQSNAPWNLLPPTPDEQDPTNSEADTSSNRTTGVWEGIFPSNVQTAQKAWYGPSSIFYFIGRIDSFLTSALQQPHSTHRLLPNSASNLLDGPTGEGQNGRLVTLSNDPMNMGEYLAPTQEEYFLNLFWQSYYTSCPVLDELEFKEHYHSLWTTAEKERRPSPLVDIVIAVCMQYGMAQIPGAKGDLSGNANSNSNGNDTSIAGRWHYRRCQKLLLSELENPTIMTLQCHILCCIYLCCASFLNMADNACGLAIRTAFMLGLHLEPSEAVPRREREMRKRLWWMLYVLEIQMSMKLGRPFMLHDTSTTCSLPADDREIAMISGSSFVPLGNNVTWLTWNLQNTKLMLVARAAYTDFHGKNPNAFSVGDGQAINERLEEWLKGVPEALKTKRQNSGTPFSTDLSALEIEQFAPLWLQRQRLLLELMYHNLCTNLYRPAIHFAQSTGSNHAFADRTAVQCAAHAMTLTHMMHQVLRSTNILAGWHEAFQWQWNAAMTLVGFLLAYPQAESAQAARAAIELSVTVFECFGNSFAFAGNAANTIRDLTAKIDMLVEQSRGDPSGLLHALKSPESLQLPLMGKESVDDSLMSGTFTAPESLDGSMGFEEDTNAEVTDVWASSIDMFSVESYSDFDWLGINSNRSMNYI
ncbi:MAG: hypothetical protein M1820_001384 [Bogoriella megaspora]|nr:MAG: hypothetical protein M1820_001384 [Bogoriella megaspora]